MQSSTESSNVGSSNCPGASHVSASAGESSDLSSSQRPSEKPDSVLVLFVRHGSTPTTGKTLPGRAPGLNLSEEGRKQADKTAERISRLSRVSAIYASPLERAEQTARPIADRTGVRVQANEDLWECDFGDWTGAELEVLSKMPQWTTVRNWPSGWRFPHGESFVDMQARMVRFIDMARERHRGEVIVAVSHADPIKAAVASSLGMHLDMFQRIVVSPASVTVISYGEHGPAVLAVNSSTSLTALQPS